MKALAAIVKPRCPGEVPYKGEGRWQVVVGGGRY